MFQPSRFRQLNVSILILICFIAGIGIFMLYSAANGSFFPWGIKQLSRFIFGFLLMLVIAVTDIRFWYAKAYAFYLVSFILLVAVELLGVVGMGAQRWIDLYIFNLQPSELMRLALVMALARYFHVRLRDDIFTLKELLIPATMIFAPAILLLRQPDLGTAVLLIGSGVALLFVAGVSYKIFLAAGALLLGGIPILWNFMHTYQQKRILTFLNPEDDALHAGYHVLQSKIALGSGGLWGKGFLQGTQSHLNFLPEKQTDFIFTMFCEEFGFIGALILLILYGLILTYNFLIALSVRNYFGQLLCIGVNTTFFLYVFINMAMVMGLVPVVGIPLPLFSYGGTSMLTILMGQGLILSVMLYNDMRLAR